MSFCCNFYNRYNPAMLATVFRQGRPNQHHNRFFIGVLPLIYSLPTDTKCHPERSEGSREILRFAQNDKLCTNLYGGKICVKVNI
jgi:hypothetical protein